MTKKQIAFTLIELLVVIAIIGILSGLIVVSMSVYYVGLNNLLINGFTNKKDYISRMSKIDLNRINFSRYC
ncbi:MAG: type II secretion system protein [Candidatus Paceibacterota bacterium]|jgi:prepilin-type N-terminal cleavage/methylation domain-containing protein